jgi:GMP synthase-like glutamine amidotransferase
MRVLLLNCDLDRSRETNGAALLRCFLKGRSVKIDVFDVYKNEFPKAGELANYGVAVITGSRASVYEKKRWIGKLVKLVREMDRQGIRTLGVCFGYQIVAKAFGGSVVKGDQYEEGFRKVSLTGRGRKDQLFAGFPNSFFVYQSHGDYVRRLPKGATLLLSNGMGAQAYRVREFACVQFHPEIFPGVAIKMHRRDGKSVGSVTGAVAKGYSLPAKVISNFAKAS